MPISDFSLFEKDLEKDLGHLERRLGQYGAGAVGDELSLNHLFQNHLASGGSRIRALLALTAGRRLGLPDAARFSIAAAVELLHQASLIHDDVQDSDTLRRGQASAWSVAGVSAAICLGDSLIGAAFAELARLPAPYSEHLPRLNRLLAQGISVMAAGQALDCRWRPTSRVRFDEYEQIVRQKSGPLLGLPIALTLAVDGGTDAAIRRILAGASSIGIAYQLADDLADKAEDHEARLNGYWLLQAQLADGAAAENVLRERFERHLCHARQAAQKLPAFCVAAFEALIDALQQKYPAFRAAA